MERLFFSDSTALFNPRPKILGTVQHFCNPEEQKCCTVPKLLCLGTKNLGTVQHSCSPEGQKCCTVPKIFGLGLKSDVLSLKNLKKKPILQNLQASEALKVLENRFFRFFRDSTALFNEKPKKLGTVQHFCNPEEQQCCTVPKFSCLGTKNLGTVQHFCNPEEQKCCTVPKFLCLETKNLGTVQHFCSPEGQKCCTVPKIFGLGLKSAVLSLKNLKNLFSRTFRLRRP